MKIYIGLDDSGRGPVIGPMILAGVAITEEQKKYLRSIGVRDSKLVSRIKRKELEKEIKRNSLFYFIEKVSPEEIDKKLEMKFNLNMIEATKFAKIINKIVEKLIEKKLINYEFIVIVDCPSNNIPKWKKFLEKYLKSGVKEKIILIAKHKAERNICVAAASILAKETREREIKDLKKKIGFDFGSGYSSDPLTINFLKNEYNKLKNESKNLYFVRHSWETMKEIENKKKQKNLKEFFY